MLLFPLTFLLSGLLGAFLSNIHNWLWEWMLVKISDREPTRFTILDWPKHPKPAEVIRVYWELYPESRLPLILNALKYGMFAAAGAAFAAFFAMIAATA